MEIRDEFRLELSQEDSERVREILPAAVPGESGDRGSPRGFRLLTVLLLLALLAAAALAAWSDTAWPVILDLLDGTLRRWSEKL